MPFFIRNNSKARRVIGQKRKGAPGSHGDKKRTEAPKPKKEDRGLEGSEDEEILSDSDIEDRGDKYVQGESDEEDKETAQEKRLRLAKEYLAQIEEQEEESDGDEGEDVVAKRIKQDILEQSGKLHKVIAETILQPTPDDIHLLRGHKLPITCSVIMPDDQHIFSASKDCSIIKWHVETSSKVKVLHGGRKGTEKKHLGHTTHILCMAVSSDGKFLVSGDRAKNIMVWNPITCERIHVLTGHRDAVSGLAFRKGTHTLFSASHDRSVKIWDLDEMAYVETLFGHQDAITAIDSLTRDRALTSGGRDGSLRIWKVLEESQLIFHGHAGSIDCVALINEENFISGADDNSLALWTVMKKKPLVKVANAHSTTQDGSTSVHESWVTAVASLQQSDLVASGSKDGCIRLWKCGPGFKTLTPLVSIPIVGFVNSLRFSATGKFLVAGIGQEHRLGRWWRMKDAKNGVAIIKLPRKDL